MRPGVHSWRRRVQGGLRNPDHRTNSASDPRRTSMVRTCGGRAAPSLLRRRSQQSEGKRLPGEARAALLLTRCVLLIMTLWLRCLRNKISFTWELFGYLHRRTNKPRLRPKRATALEIPALLPTWPWLVVAGAITGLGGRPESRFLPPPEFMSD